MKKFLSMFLAIAILMSMAVPAMAAEETVEMELVAEEVLATENPMSEVYYLQGTMDTNAGNDYQNKELDKYVEELSKRTGLPVVTITRRKLYSNQNEVFPCADPKQFVELVSGAEYVVTNSFHGTAFSVNFSKKFVTFKGEKRNSRITDLLGTLGIPERAVSSYSEELFNLPDIDYDKVRMNLDSERKESLAYINKVLESAKKND